MANRTKDSSVADSAIAHSADLADEYPAIMSAADLRTVIAHNLLRAEFAAAAVDSADWIGEAPELDARAGFNMESEG